MNDPANQGMTPRQQIAERDWIRRQTEEAVNNVTAPLEDYATATWFDLKARADYGDGLAVAELERRRNS